METGGKPQLGVLQFNDSAIIVDTTTSEQLSQGHSSSSEVSNKIAILGGFWAAPLLVIGKFF